MRPNRPVAHTPTAERIVKRKPIKPWLRAAYQAINGLHLKSYEVYQPVMQGGKYVAGTRKSDTRWDAIRKVLDATESKSLVDLGCCEGYYVIQSAKHGLPINLGIDFDQRRIFTCNNQVVLYDLQNAGFLMAPVEHRLVEGLPAFDAVVFLSVLHHMMYQHGVEYCQSLMKLVHAKTAKVCLFEMGQSDEHKESWAKDMPDMGSDPHAWIADFLTEAGFSKVEKIGTTSSYAQESERALFAAYH